jgi:hypothetical protein
VARRTARFAQSLLNAGQEWVLNIDSRGTAPSSRPGAVYYATVDYRIIRSVFNRLQLRRSDIFVDVGAGKGRVVCLAAQYRLKLVLGVEYEFYLATLAKLNVMRMRGRRTPVEIHTMPAEEFDYSSATALYFFNPFEAEVLDLVLHKVNQDRAGGPVRIAFVMESHRQRSIFASHSWLHCYDRWVDEAGHANALYRTE